MSKKYKQIMKILDELIPYIRGTADSFMYDEKTQKEAQEILDTYDKIIVNINSIEKDKYERNTNTNSSWRFPVMDYLLESLKDLNLLEDIKPFSHEEELMEDLDCLKTELVNSIENFINNTKVLYQEMVDKGKMT